ncbi:MAG TPA: nucleotidyltransferase family protein [Rhabdochlamydiaceae bacterium]
MPVLKKHAVKRAAVFGSFARGEARARSDIDLLIEYKAKDKSLFDLVDLKAELEYALNCKVDIVTYNSIYSGVLKQILAEQIIIL